MSEKKIIEINDYISIQVEFIDDPDGGYWQAQETLGTYDDKPSKWAIDCKNGWLLGDEESEPEYISDFEEDEPYRDDYESQEEFDTDMQSYRDKLEAWRQLDKKYSEDFENWEDRRGYKILRDVRRSCYDRNSYQFFHPEYSKYLLEEEKPTELTEEQIDTIEKQYNRMVELNNGWWGYIGIEVTLLVHEKEVAFESLWGIESDDKEYHKEVVEQLLGQLAPRIRAEIDDEISALYLQATRLEEATDHVPTEESILEKVMQEI